MRCNFFEVCLAAMILVFMVISNSNAREVPCFLLGPNEWTVTDIARRTLNGTPKRIRDQMIGRAPIDPETRKQACDIRIIKVEERTDEFGETVPHYTVDLDEKKRLVDEAKEKADAEKAKRERQNAGRDKRLNQLTPCATLPFNASSGQIVSCIQKLAKDRLIDHGRQPEDEEPVESAGFFENAWDQVMGIFDKGKESVE